MGNILFFDTETTGLPKSWSAPITDSNNWPRLVQIAMIQTDMVGNILWKAVHIVKPEGFTIPKSASNIHGITTEHALKEGISLDVVLCEFTDLVHKSDIVVAHNIKFDERIAGAELIRANIEHDLFETKRMCTMLLSTKYCKLPSRSGFKWPNLTELYTILFGKFFEGAHDAMADIQATADCFWELHKRGVITI